MKTVTQKQKPITERNCFEELERLCRIVCECKVAENELVFFRKQIQIGLDKLTEIRKKKQAEKDEKERIKLEVEAEKRRKHYAKKSGL